MYKQIINNIQLQLVMQQPPVADRQKNHQGILSKDGNGFRFEEAVKIKRPRRNPKIYEGEYVSLVHRSDGKYACSLKHISNKNGKFDPQDVAFRMYMELIDALQIIN